MSLMFTRIICTHTHAYSFHTLVGDKSHFTHHTVN